jgi:UrcA family protein
MTALRKRLLSLAVATIVSLATSTSAAADDRSATRTVKAWDLDLGKPADVQTLYGRVREAAANVCRAEEQRHWKNTRVRAPLGWREQCVSESVDAAVRNVANPRLAALHN